MTHEFPPRLIGEKGQKVKKYTLLACLGHGEEAEVWKAEHRVTQQLAAIRIFKPKQVLEDAQQQFRSDVNILRRLTDHPHILPFWFSSWNRGYPYLVMPYIPDGSLANELQTLIRSGQRLPFTKSVMYIKNIMAALLYIHSCRYLHGNVKPSNVLLGREGLLLSDCDIALHFKATSAITRQPSGSLSYMAPEQKSGQPVPASDQYALAVTGCEMLTGKQLDGLEDLRGVYPHIAQVFTQALAPEPSQRFLSMKHFLDAFDEAALADAESASLVQIARSPEHLGSDDSTQPSQFTPGLDPYRTQVNVNDGLGNQTQPSQLMPGSGLHQMQVEVNAGHQTQPSQLMPGSGLPQTQIGHTSEIPHPQPPQKPYSQLPRSVNRRFWQRGLVVVSLLGLLLGGFVGARTFLTPAVTTLCIATNLPEHGSEQASGDGVINAVQLALSLSSFATDYKGHRVVLYNMDDTSNSTASGHVLYSPDPTVGVMNIQQLMQPNSSSPCPNPIAIIGPRDSKLAPGEIAEATKDGILLLTPSSTAPCLTLPNYPDSAENCKYDGKSRTFGRLPGNDIDQGEIIDNLLSQFAKSTPNPNIVIVDDEEIYGVQLAQAVVAQLNNLSISLSACITPNAHQLCSSISDVTPTPFSSDQISDLAQHIKSEKPTAVFFAGGDMSPDAFTLRKELGSGIPFVVGDALLDSSKFLGNIGPDAANIYATFPAIDPFFFNSSTATPNEKKFYTEYVQQFGGPPQPYSANGYDAANIVLQTLKDMIDAGQPITSINVAQTVLSNDAGKDFVGLAGNLIKFNNQGDNTGPHIYTIYKSAPQPDGSWSWSIKSTQTTPPSV